MRTLSRFVIVPVLFMGVVGGPATAVASNPVTIPAARVGDVLRVSVLEEGWTLRVEGRTTASDRWGRDVNAFEVSVEGFHPVEFESKKPTRHTIFLDAASGTQIADTTRYIFGGEGGVSSEPAAYSAFEPNDPDGWPGWVASGGILAGRTLVPGETVELPFVMTNTRGANSIGLRIEESDPQGGSRCVLATGSTSYPLFTYHSPEGLQRSTVTVAVEITHCADSPYARRTRLTYSGSIQHSVELSAELLSRGDGEPVGAGSYPEPRHHVASGPAPFDGLLRDGGSVEVPSIEAAQDAAALAPGLLLWRVAHPGAYLVEAEFLTGTYAATPSEAERWRLVFAAPDGAAHEVHVAMRGPAPVAVDVPLAEPYPAPVPALSTWPDDVSTLGGIIAAWRKVAGPTARLAAVRWQPLLDQNWYVVGGVTITCETGPCGTLYGEIPFDVVTGAVGTGEHPVT